MLPKPSPPPGVIPLSAGDDFDSGTASGHNGKPLIAGDQRGFECFRQHEIGGIISSAVGPELPDPVKKCLVGIPDNPEGQMIVDCLTGTGGREFPGDHKPPQYVGDPEVDEMGGGDCLA